MLSLRGAADLNDACLTWLLALLPGDDAQTSSEQSDEGSVPSRSSYPIEPHLADDDTLNHTLDSDLTKLVAQIKGPSPAVVAGTSLYKARQQS
jgi:hypothetical protein